MYVNKFFAVNMATVMYKVLVTLRIFFKKVFAVNMATVIYKVLVTLQIFACEFGGARSNSIVSSIPL